MGIAVHGNFYRRVSLGDLERQFDLRRFAVFRRDNNRSLNAVCCLCRCAGKYSVCGKFQTLWQLACIVNLECQLAQIGSVFHIAVQIDLGHRLFVSQFQLVHIGRNGDLHCLFFHSEHRIAGHEINIFSELGLAVKVAVSIRLIRRFFQHYFIRSVVIEFLGIGIIAKSFVIGQCQPNDCPCLLVEGRDLVLADGLVEVQQISNFTICELVGGFAYAVIICESRTLCRTGVEVVTVFDDAIVTAIICINIVIAAHAANIVPSTRNCSGVVAVFERAAIETTHTANSIRTRNRSSIITVFDYFFIITAHTTDRVFTLKIRVHYANILNDTTVIFKQTSIASAVSIAIQTADRMSLSIKCASVIAMSKFSDRCPSSPTVCTNAIISRKIALIDYDIFFQNSTCIFIRIVIKRTACGIHKCRKPVQLTGVGDLVVSSCLIQRCRLVMCFALFLGAEAVFIVVRYICCFGIGVFHHTTIRIGVDRAMGVVKSRKSVIADRLIKTNVRLIAVEQISNFTACEFVGGFACAVGVVKGCTLCRTGVEVVTVGDCIIVIVTVHATNSAVSTKNCSDVVAVGGFGIVSSTSAHTTNPVFTRNRFSVVAVFNRTTIVTTHAADKSFTRNRSGVIAVFNRTVIVTTHAACIFVSAGNCSSVVAVFNRTTIVTAHTTDV